MRQLAFISKQFFCALAFGLVTNLVVWADEPLVEKSPLEIYEEQLQRLDRWMWHPQHQEVREARSEDYRHILKFLSEKAGHKILNRRGEALQVATHDFVEWLNKLPSPLLYIREDGSAGIFAHGKVNIFPELKVTWVGQTNIPYGSLSYQHDQDRPQVFEDLDPSEKFYLMVPENQPAYLQDLHSENNWNADWLTHVWALPAYLDHRIGERIPLLPLPLPNTVLKEGVRQTRGKHGINTGSISLHSSAEVLHKNLPVTSEGFVIPRRAEDGNRPDPLVLSITDLQNLVEAEWILLHYAISRLNPTLSSRLLNMKHKMPEDHEAQSEFILRNAEDLEVYAASLRRGLETIPYVSDERAADHRPGERGLLSRITRMTIRLMRFARQDLKQKFPAQQDIVTQALDDADHIAASSDEMVSPETSKKRFSKFAKSVWSTVDSRAKHLAGITKLDRAGQLLKKHHIVENLAIYVPMAGLTTWAAMRMAEVGPQAFEFMAASATLVASGVIALIAYNDQANKTIQEGRRLGLTDLGRDDSIDLEFDHPPQSKLRQFWRFITHSEWASGLMRRARENHYQKVVLGKIKTTAAGIKIESEGIELPLPKSLMGVGLPVLSAFVWSAYVASTPLRAIVSAIYHTALPLKARLALLNLIKRDKIMNFEEFISTSFSKTFWIVSGYDPVRLLIKLAKPNLHKVREAGGAGDRRDGGGHYFFEIPFRRAFGWTPEKAQTHITRHKILHPALEAAVRNRVEEEASKLGITSIQKVAIGAQNTRFTQSLHLFDTGLTKQQLQKLRQLENQLVILSRSKAFQRQWQERFRDHDFDAHSLEAQRAYAYDIASELLWESLPETPELAPRLKRLQLEAKRQRIDFKEHIHERGRDIINFYTANDSASAIQVTRIIVRDEIQKKPVSLPLMMLNSWGSGRDFANGSVGVFMEAYVNTTANILAGAVGHGRVMRYLYDPQHPESQKYFRDLAKAFGKTRWERSLLQTASVLEIRAPYFLWSSLLVGVSLFTVDMLKLGGGAAGQALTALGSAGAPPQIPVSSVVQESLMLRSANAAGAALAGYSFAIPFSLADKVYYAARLAIGGRNPIVYKKDENGELMRDKKGQLMIDEEAIQGRIKKDQVGYGAYLMIKNLIYAGIFNEVIQSTSNAILDQANFERLYLVEMLDQETALAPGEPTNCSTSIQTLATK